MSRDDLDIARRSLLVASVSSLVSLAGCADVVSELTGGQETPADPADSEEPRIEQGEWGTYDTDLIRLGAFVDGWVGIGPDGLTDEQNPLIRLQRGRTYEVLWENRDGEHHQFAIVDTNGDEVISTEPAGDRGATRSVEFAAASEFAEYYCTFHTETMRGEVRIDGDQ